MVSHPTTGDGEMVIRISPELEAALNESARRQGVAPEVLANAVLRERFLPSGASFASQDEWEGKLLALATDCGVSLPHSALSSEGLYE
jgi:hypothetical protein